MRISDSSQSSSHDKLNSNMNHLRNSFTRYMRILWENSERILIVLFLLIFPLNLRKVFLTPYSFQKGYFIEYLTSNLSFADIIVLLTIFIFTIKIIIRQINEYGKVDNLLEYNKLVLSSIFKYLSGMTRETVVLIFFVLLVLISVSWATYKPIAVYRAATIIGTFAFFSILALKLRPKKWLITAILFIILSGLFQSSVGIAQFINNGSVGIQFLGESIVSPNISGVAKIHLLGVKHIRAYGTTPHPNVLAGFLIIPICLVSLLIVSPQRNLFPGIPDSRETLKTRFLKWFLAISLFLTFLGLCFTFSRSAFLGLFLGILIILSIKFAAKRTHYMPKFSSKHVCVLLAIILLIFLVSCVLFYSTSFFSSQSLSERNFYTNVSYATIKNNPIWGLGIGQFVFSFIQKYPSIEGWMHQPVHNIYLLVFSELGFVGFALFMLFIFLIFSRIIEKRNYPQQLTAYHIYCIILSYLFICLFDHYFWDIEIGLFSFALSISFFYIIQHLETTGD